MKSSTIFKSIIREKYFAIATFGFVLWIAETAFFGFNVKSESTAETLFDFISGILIAWGIIGDILANVTIIKKNYSTFNETHNITTKEVKVTGKEPKINYTFGTTKKETVDLLKLGRGDKKPAEKESKK